MSAFNSFVVGSWNAIWNLLLLLLIVLIVPVLRLIVVVLIQSVHVVLHIVALIMATAISLHVLTTATTETLEVALILHSTSSEILLTASRSWLLSPHLLILSWSLVAVLVLNTFLCQYELLWCELIARFAKFFVSVSKVAFFLEKAIFMRFVMTASFGFVFLVQFFHFLLIWCLVPLIHDHLISHQVLLSILLVVWHHAHHLWVVKHLIRHLRIILLHLLHAHAHVVHVVWHSAHLIGCLHLSCSVHIEI